MFKAVCFDFDYTLGDCTDSIVAGFQYGLTGLGWPAPDREAVRRTVGFLLEDAYSMLTGDLDPENQARFRALFTEVARERQIHETILFPGAPELLRGMEEHASFDAIRFTNAQGLNTASDGQTSDSRDRNYFLNGMQGKSGMEVLRSRITDQMMTVFYAPVEHDGEITGVLLGLYFAEDYLRDMLTTSYFGEAAGVFLCTREGRVIASSAPTSL